ncbi:MAG TPA: hypothetical protein VNB64_12325 [Solirubrobacteraceae bacterium]|nr:hypothetical protein [Solirubrobacteraceae bacterium]
MSSRTVLAAAVLALGLLPGTASGAVTIGSNLAGDAVDNLPGYCGMVCTGTNLNLPATSTAANGLTSPITGVVVRYRVKSGSAGDAVALRVLRPGGGTTFTGAGTSGPGTLLVGMTELAAQVSIQSGDSVGLNVANEKIVWANTGGATGLAWGQPNGFPTGLADGATGAGAGQTSRELLVQAVVEPDADADGFGDETQDGCPADSARQTPPCGTGDPNPNGNPPPPSLAAPRITLQRVVPASFRLGSLARLRFRLSELASYRLTFDQRLPGRVRGRRCLPESRTVRTGTRCAAYRRRGVRRGRGSAGLKSLAFRGRLAGRALPLGRYRVTFGAVDVEGNPARSRTTFFTLRAPLRR